MARLESAGHRIEELFGQLQQLESRLEAAHDEVRVITERMATAEEAVVTVNHERAREVARTDEAKAHADEAKARADEAKARADEAESRAREAETRIREVEARAGTTVADYKASTDFVQEVVETSLGAYAEGFDLCKARISAAFSLSGPELDIIQAGGIDEETAAEEKEEETRERPGPDRP